MPTLTLDGLSDDALRRLHERARHEQRTPAEEAAALLEAALTSGQIFPSRTPGRPSFSDAIREFRESWGPSLLDDETFDATFAGLRSPELGRPSPFDDDESAR